MNFAKADPTILVIGQSHVEAVLSANPPENKLKIINLNSVDRSISIADKINLGGYLPEPAENSIVFSMIGGNFHNTFGLIESSLPFDFVEPESHNYSFGSKRYLITYELIFRYFTDAMRGGFLRSILKLKNYYGTPFVHIISPPPIGDDEHIKQNPGGYFKDKVHLGVTPAELRGKLYRLHTRVIVEFCQEHGIPTLPPPAEAVTEDGFLARPFWKNDPTHANAAYGRLVLEQLRGYTA